jgi:hypothetical protein
MILAITFIVFAVSCIVLAFICKNSSTTFIGTSTSFATLAGAILVFSTLDMQRKALEEENSKNNYSRFDSRFYPILSSFRMDAANMENTLERIKEKGKGYGFPYCSSFWGEKAFFINRKILETLYINIKKNTFEVYDAENIRIELDEIGKIETSLMDDWASEDDLDKIYKKRVDYLHSQQGGFLLYKYGITKEVWEKYKNAEKNELISFLLDRLLLYQPTILSKYIRGLRFMLHIIDDIPKKLDKKDYYLNISCLLGKEEMLFLNCFEEFNIITNN